MHNGSKHMKPKRYKVNSYNVVRFFTFLKKKWKIFRVSLNLKNEEAAEKLKHYLQCQKVKLCSKMFDGAKIPIFCQKSKLKF